MNDLALMLETQYQLQCDTFGDDPDLMSEAERAAFVAWNVLAATDELHECLNEVGWKKWATSKHVNDDALFGEIVDVWHFVMNLIIVACPGMTSEDIADRLTRHYFAKRAVNIQRQRDVYDGVSTKGPDGRALDEPTVPRHVLL